MQKWITKQLKFYTAKGLKIVIAYKIAITVQSIKDWFRSYYNPNLTVYLESSDLPTKEQLVEAYSKNRAKRFLRTGMLVAEILWPR